MGRYPTYKSNEYLSSGKSEQWVNLFDKLRNNHTANVFPELRFPGEVSIVIEEEVTSKPCPVFPKLCVERIFRKIFAPS
jgi:hypothetical protein